MSPQLRTLHPRGTTVLDAAAPGPGKRKDGRPRGEQRIPGSNESPACNGRYGRWVPGGDTELALEDLADRVIRGTLDYETAVRLTEALVDAVGKPCATKRDLLTVLSRKREAHHRTA